VLNQKPPFRRLSRVLAKYLFFSNMTVFSHGRVLVVRYFPQYELISKAHEML
jgi:hypothetical protein